jgi:hypothetical protein
VGAFRVDYVTNTLVYSWPLPIGTSIVSAFDKWTSELKETAFASLRSRGNSERNRTLAIMFRRWRDEMPSLSGLWPFTNNSFMGVAWWHPNVFAARRFVRLRLGVWGCETDYRRAVHKAARLKKSVQSSAELMAAVKPILPRLESPEDRACYLCPADSWMPETMPHLFLFCCHPSMVQLRDEVRTALQAIVDRSGQLAEVPQLPDLSSQIELFSILMLCTSVGYTADREHGVGVYALDVLRPVGAAAHSEEYLRVLRANSWLRLDHGRMQVVAEWLSFCFDAYRQFLASGRHSFVSLVGSDIVSTVVTYCQRVYSVRRRLLREDVEYLARGRDPADPSRLRQQQHQPQAVEGAADAPAHGGIAPAAHADARAMDVGADDSIASSVSDADELAISSDDEWLFLNESVSGSASEDTSDGDYSVADC